MTMIEKVATAIGEKIGPALSGGKPTALKDVARAAIEAMREPSDSIRETMNGHASNGMVNWNDYHDALIDAALADEKAQT